MNLLLAACLLQDGAWDPEKTWVFMVGILDWKEQKMYGSFPQKGRRDQELADFFKARGVAEDRIVLLKDAAATKAAIQEAFGKFVARPAAGDLMLVYYAGHGTKTDDGTGYFVPYDAGADTAKSCWSVPSVLDAVEAGFKGGRVLLTADCCYSGTLAEEAGRRVSKPRTASLTSSRSSASSTGNWTFTECLLAGFRGDPAVDLDGDGTVWIDELATYAEAEMAFTEEQLTTYIAGEQFRLKLSTTGRKAHPRLGERLEAKDKEDKWYKARVIGTKDEQVKVAYVGWDATWDEWLGKDRIRPFAPRQFPRDMKVQVRWKKDWYSAGVLDGKLGLHHIHYDGYSKAWDEWVSPGRIRAGQEPDTADSLRALGAQVTETGGAITRVSFKDSSKLGDAEFRRLGRLKDLKALTLYGGCKGLTDSTLPHLAGLAQLEEFQTDGIQVTDAGLAQFAAISGLRSIAFFHPSLDLKGFDGSGFAALKALPRLERLTVAGTRFNDKGMAAIAELGQLREFRTWHTHQTQAGNAALEKLPALRSLRLGQRLRRWDGASNAASLDDATLDALSRLKTLEDLTLDEARISLDALLKLKALPKLRKLELLRIDIPAEDVERLKAALPEAKIEWKPLNDDERKKLEAYLKP